MSILISIYIRAWNSFSQLSSYLSEICGIVFFTYVKSCHFIPCRFICNTLKITCLLHKIRSCNTWLLYAHDNILYIYIYYVVVERTKVPFLMLELEGCKRMKRKNRTVKVTGRINRIYSRKEARKWNVNRVQKRKSCHADCGVDSLLHMCLDTVIPVIIKFQSLIKAFT